MKRSSITTMLTVLLALWLHDPAPAQKLQAFNLQAHGYATQSFIYSNQNNWNTTNSTSGSAEWTEGVLSLSAQPNYRLRLGAQARSYLLGTYDKKFLFDWALVEFKLNEHLGLRGGKVKTPTGLLSESQDIDPAHLWILLPQSIYPIASRTALLSNYGGVFFGSVALGERFGRLEYRAYGGERVIPAKDPYLDPLQAIGLYAPDGLRGPGKGGSLQWRTPIQGLMVGASFSSEVPSGKLLYGPLTGALTVRPIDQPFFFGRYEHRNLVVSGEYNRSIVNATFKFSPLPPILNAADARKFYLTASYRVLPKLNAGAYYSSSLDRRAAFTPARYQKDWTIAARYDLTSNFYFKAEQHFLDGTLIDYSAADNTAGLAETSRLSLLKLGVSF